MGRPYEPRARSHQKKRMAVRMQRIRDKEYLHQIIKAEFIKHVEKNKGLIVGADKLNLAVTEAIWALIG